MTLNVVLGSGEMPTKELTASLEDLQARAVEDKDSFWFLIHAKSEPTATDRALMSWLEKNDVWYSIVSDGTDVDPVYEGDPQERHVAKRLAPKIVELMKSGPEEGESAQLLALFVSDDFSASEDRWLNDVGAAVQEAGFVVRALNDGLVEVDMLDNGGDEPEEEEPEEDDAPEEEESIEGLLDEMTRDQLIAHAQLLGITFPPRTRMNTMVAAILNHKAPNAEEVEEEVEEEEDDAPAPSLAVVDDAFVPSSTTNVASISAPAMMIIVSNGTVTSRVVTAEQIETMLASVR